MSGKNITDSFQKSLINLTNIYFQKIKIEAILRRKITKKHIF